MLISAQYRCSSNGKNYGLAHSNPHAVGRLLAVLFNLLMMPLERVLRNAPVKESLILGSFCSVYGLQSLPKCSLAQNKVDQSDITGHALGSARLGRTLSDQGWQLSRYQTCCRGLENGRGQLVARQPFTGRDLIAGYDLVAAVKVGDEDVVDG